MAEQEPRRAGTHADLRPRRRVRWGPLALVVLLHAVVLAGLVRAFAPNFTSAAIERATSLVTVTVRTRPPEPEASPSPDPAAAAEGGAAAAGRKAEPREVMAPVPKVTLPRPDPAPKAAASGSADSAGATDAGAGTGAGGEGSGTGAGRAGSGQGGIPVTRPEKIAGDINDARDYPVPPGGRAARQGQQVVVYMTVGVDGRARDCRVVEPSTDPEADRITCALAEDRFRFRPARDAAGNPVSATYGWRQRWF
ncbi:energy transducer TonB [Altererythrobacter sp. B11]|uniref:energy transducer TonB n=1 Tax=Altererythrobacter sp. B11 TaxID=2060312 RepID=UPI000E5B5721|nr:energy transducer TonB [Altererythrobacter sp. B11]